MNPYGWNLNPMASYSSEKPNSVRCWIVPFTMTGTAIHMLQGDFWRMEQFFKHFSFHSKKVEAEVIKQTESQTQPQAQTTGSGTKGEGKGKASYEEWTNKEQSFLVDLWAKKHDHLESKDARKV